MKKDDARLAVLREYDSWAKKHPSNAKEMGGFVFFRYLEKENQTFSIFVAVPANGKSFTCGFVTEVDWKIKDAIAPIMNKLATKRNAAWPSAQYPVMQPTNLGVSSSNQIAVEA